MMLFSVKCALESMLFVPKIGDRLMHGCKKKRDKWESAELLKLPKKCVYEKPPITSFYAQTSFIFI